VRRDSVKIHLEPLRRQLNRVIVFVVVYSEALHCAADASSSLFKIKCAQNAIILMQNKLCARPHDLPGPCTPHAAAQLQLIHALRLRRPAALRHEYSLSTGSGSLWL